ncbi:MAG TPA: hypothetical protein VJM11_13360, partial [Nevskiaceae bacterium]|nr:hypothetical protein [Nevskiaceae bacterium]
VEHWRLTIANTTDRARIIEVTTYQESTLAPVDTYRRTPPFAAIHVTSTFVRGLGALLARNRLLKGDATQGPISREVAFHATDAAERGPVRLVGYEDTRPAFLGAGTLAAPAAFERALREPADEGQLAPFDPCAALRVHADLEPRGAVDVRFLDGYARDETVAADRIARHLGRPLPAALPGVLDRTRTLAVPASRAPREPFSADGWTVTAAPDEPRPWTHVIANPLGHGAVVSAEGAIFAFAGNAQQNALTPPCLDTVACAQPGELLLVLDRDRDRIASPTWIPARSADARATTTFAPGRARFLSHDGDLALALDVFASPDAPLQFRRLRLANHGPTPRRLRVLAYAEIVLAEVPQDSRDQVDVAVEGEVLLYRRARNAFVGGWAFAACSLVPAVASTTRAQVVGHARALARPHLLLHGTPDAGCADDGTRCAAFCGEIELAAGASTDVVLVLGQAADRETAAALARRHADPLAAEEASSAVERAWRERLDVLRVDTGDPAFDRLVNVWLPYQVLASRVWGRAGPSQRSGATGFRDQLQDVLPFALLDPPLARAQIVRHAAQQFREGDVVKWWHDAPDGRIGIAVRTRASDPHLWLPYVALRYVEATGDAAVLDEVVPFLEGAPVPPGKEGFMLAPRAARERATVYEHCRRAVEHSLAALGAHGLPLMGSGDWNDGLDALGLHGRGESTWLAFFLHDVLRAFAPVAAVREGATAGARYQLAADRLARAAELQWRDGAYVRGTDDDGRALAYADALTAAWAVLSGAVGLERGVEALEKGLASLERDTRVLLLAPAFDERSVPYPGRIAEYPAGVRENGGQYSHGASWLVDAWLACAALAAQAGRSDDVAHAQRRARDLWWKISPLTKTTPHERARYGLPPHQQPADVYEGPGYEGRGGWSWYTGAAARMLSAAYALLGIELVGGVVRARPGAAIAARSIAFRGREITAQHSG